jgi:hypothetical protein
MASLFCMALRRLALLSIAFVLCMLVAIPAAAGAATVGCAPRCGGDAPAAQSPAHPVPEACLHNPTCGGGLALGLGMAAGIGMLATAVPAIGAALTGRRRGRPWSPPRLGRLLVGGLFRPPRLLLDV